MKLIVRAYYRYRLTRKVDINQITVVSANLGRATRKRNHHHFVRVSNWLGLLLQSNQLCLMSHHSCFEHKQSETNQHPYRDTFFSLILSAFNIKVFKKIPNGLGCIKRARAIRFMSSVGDYPVVDFGSFFYLFYWSLGSKWRCIILHLIENK